MSYKSTTKPLLLAASIGFVAMIGQLSFTRLTAQTFSGNELTFGLALGHWLFWTGIGASIGSLLVKKYQSPRIVRFLIPLFGFTLLIFLYVQNLLRAITGVSTAMLIGIDKIFLWTEFIYFFPCLINGLFFPFLVRWLEKENPMLSLNRIYAAEVIGSAIGSLFFAGMLIIGLNSYQILHISVLTLFILVSILLYKKNRQRLLFLFFCIVPVILSLIFGFNRILEKKWHPFRIRSFQESPFLSLSVVEYDNNLTIFGDSEPLWTFGVAEKTEELAHFALTSHPAPKSVLLIGICPTDLEKEVFRHPSINSLTSVQPDKILDRVIRKSAEDQPNSPECRTVFADPLVYLRNCPVKFDVIILNEPPPVNAQWNRFYTTDFFAEVYPRLNPDGILSIQLPGGETYLSEDHVRFLKIIKNSIRKVFPFTTWIPGETIHLLASNQPISTDLSAFSKQIRLRNLKTFYFRDYFLADRLNPERIEFLESRIQTCDETAINRINAPIGFYFDTILWDQCTGGWLKPIFQTLRQIPNLSILIGWLILSALPFIFLVWKKSPASINRLTMFMIGFIGMSLESVLIIVYQNRVGALYLGIVFLMFSYMIGMGFGAIWISPRFSNLSCFVSILIFGTTVLVISSFLLTIFGSTPTITGIGIYTILFLTGICIGALFPQLTILSQRSNNRLMASVSGTLYAWDMFGATIGAYLTTGIFIPIWGIESTLILIFLSIITVFFGNRITKNH
ncbi:MAG: hypothetical protein PHW79_05220 [Candidatus Marinimicrobia bacterium]|nr:hypothetical protein [Candidatus Neomarinimicrobiota bacterium]